MSWQSRYETARDNLLADESICSANREVFRQFFAFEEYKLKRQNRLRRLDEPCFKTLYEYVRLLRNVESWFEGKAWVSLTREDIKQVYDDLEDGKIRNKAGKPIQDRASYYNKILKSKPFRIAGKSELAKDVIEFSTPSSDSEVRFVTEETFRLLTSVVSNPAQLLLLWLAWDLGENVDALLRLRKHDFVRQRNKQTREAEYLVNFPKGIIKRSRRSRTEPTLYSETVRYADMVLCYRGPHEAVFDFGYAQAWKYFRLAVRRTSATCMPSNNPVRWKDLRSGMACHLLKSGWTREEVDARLGHTPQSKALNAYINYLAIDRERPKKRLFDSSLELIQNELEEARRREKLSADRIRRQAEENEVLRAELERTKSDVGALRELVEQAVGKMAPRAHE